MEKVKLHLRAHLKHRIEVSFVKPWAALFAACLGLSLSGSLVVPASFAQSADDAQSKAPRQANLPAPPTPIAPPEQAAILLGEGDVGDEQWERFLNQTTVRNVSVAALYPVKPDPNKANGKAIIVAPGGGYLFAAMENEGFPVAERLAEAGYSAFVLKYRTIETPREPKAFLQLVAARFQVFGREPLEAFVPAVDDLSSAIDYLSKNCEAYGCTGEDIGVIGFSAGGRSVLELFAQLPKAAPVRTVALIYPPMTKIPESSRFPPVFLAIAADDPLFRQGGFALPEALGDKADQFEFHLYGAGGHGFGTLRKGATSEDWLNQYLHWLSVLPDGS